MSMIVANTNRADVERNDRTAIAVLLMRILPSADRSQRRIVQAGVPVADKKLPYTHKYTIVI